MPEESCRHERIFTTENAEIAFIDREDPGSFVTKHWHESIEIIYILRGSTEVLIGDAAFRVGAGECMVVNCGVVHSTRNVEGNRCILLQIPLNVLERYIPNAGKVYFDLPLSSDNGAVQKRLDHIKKLIFRMRDTILQKKDGYMLRFSSLMYELLYQMYHYFGSDRPAMRLPEEVRREGSRLKEVIAYTEQHYRENIHIAEIAAVTHLQPEYFCRYFKQCMGMTYLEYLSEVRLAYIYRDLLETDLPLYQILDRHGFSNYKLFRKLFYKRFQCTPGQMRKTHPRQQLPEMGLPEQAIETME